MECGLPITLTDPQALLGQMSQSEKLAALSGELDFWPGLLLMTEGAYQRQTWNSPGVARLGVAGIRFVDGPRGVVIAGATTFPVAIARGASFDVALEERIGLAMGLEARAVGANVFGGICINLLRHPAWGRAQETYGEDSCHVGEMAAAAVRGVKQNAIACIKHFAANSMENARFEVDVRIAPRALHEVYLAHFKRAIDAGAMCVMSAYNQLNGQWCGHHQVLLRDILKTRWNFQGFVISDFLFGMRDAKSALAAGMDLEMPFKLHYASALPKLLAEGGVEQALIDDANVRLLRAELSIPSSTQPLDRAGVLGCAAHRALALESAQKSIVLLRNEGLLPLATPASLALFGALARVANTGDAGSSNTAPAHVITVLDGLRQALPRCQITPVDATEREAIAAQARAHEVAVVVVGYTSADEGEYISPDSTSAVRQLFPKPRLAELWAALKTKRNVARMRAASGQLSRGGDRLSLRLSAADEALIEVVSAANPNTVVCVMAGSAVQMSAWLALPRAVLMLWYPGMEGGHALADVLLGKVNPSAKLPFVIAQDAADLPHFERAAKRIEYDLWHGYRLLDRNRITPEFAFGFGLSYTRFELCNLRLEGDFETADDVAARPCVRPSAGEAVALCVCATLRNLGERAGAEVVQLYVGALTSRVPRATKSLAGFVRVELGRGESIEVRLPLTLDALSFFDQTQDRWVIEAAVYSIELARHARDPQALRAEFVIDQDYVR